MTPVTQLQFEDDLKITKMFSADGESVEITEELYPNGNVEDWLLEVERVMRETLRATLGQALKVYPTVSTIIM